MEWRAGCFLIFKKKLLFLFEIDKQKEAIFEFLLLRYNIEINNIQRVDW